MSTQEEVQKLIIYLSLTVTNLLYILIVYLLVTFAEFEWNHIGLYIYSAGTIFSLLTMSIISYKAYKEDLDLSKTITKLAVFHVPCLLGLAVFMFYGVGVI